MQKPMLQASHGAAYFIAKSKKAANIGDDIIKLCLVKMAENMLGNEAVSFKLCMI